MKSVRLLNFIKRRCANWDEHYKCCLFDRIGKSPTEDSCLVSLGKRCIYLEKAVLGPVDYKFRESGVNWQKIFDLYSIATGRLAQIISSRICKCGAALLPRKQLCDSCRKVKV
jgi:hypothetical protein